MPDDLREQIERAVFVALLGEARVVGDMTKFLDDVGRVVDVVLAVLAERERQIRTKIEALQGLDWEGEQPYALGPWLHRNDVLNELNKA